MEKEIEFTRLMIGDIYLEKDINNEPRIIMKDELGDEWVLVDRNSSHGFTIAVEKKEGSFYFNEKNRIKKPDLKF